MEEKEQLTQDVLDEVTRDVLDEEAAKVTQEHWKSTMIYYQLERYEFLIVNWVMYYS